MKTIFETDDARTLDPVREIVERWNHRPAPNQLRCVPLKTFVIQPVPEWKRKWLRIEELINRKSQ